MHLGRLRLEVRALGRADPPLPQAHGGQALPVRRVQPQLLPLRPPGAAHEEAPELSCPRPPPPAPRSPLSRSLNYMIDSIYIYKRERKHKTGNVYFVYLRKQGIHCVNTKVFGPCPNLECLLYAGLTQTDAIISDRQPHLSTGWACKGVFAVFFPKAPPLNVTVFSKQVRWAQEDSWIVCQDFAWHQSFFSIQDNSLEVRSIPGNSQIAIEQMCCFVLFFIWVAYICYSKFCKYANQLYSLLHVF